MYITSANASVQSHPMLPLPPPLPANDDSESHTNSIQLLLSVRIVPRTFESRYLAILSCNKHQNHHHPYKPYHTDPNDFHRIDNLSCLHLHPYFGTQ